MGEAHGRDREHTSESCPRVLWVTPQCQLTVLRLRTGGISEREIPNWGTTGGEKGGSKEVHFSAVAVVRVAA